jgi:hypothetical protein
MFERIDLIKPLKAGGLSRRCICDNATLRRQRIFRRAAPLRVGSDRLFAPGRRPSDVAPAKLQS